MTFGDFFERLARWTTYLLLFLLPLFFLPWSRDILETNKQTIFLVLLAIGCSAWMGSMMAKKRCEFQSGWLNLFPILFLLGLLGSSFFSRAGYQTWIGQSSQESMSFVTGAFLVASFYLFANIHRTVQEQGRVLTALLLSTTLSGLFTITQFIPVLKLPFGFAQTVGFNTIGTFNSFALFLTIVSFLGLSMWIVSSAGRDRLIPQGGAGVFVRTLISLIFFMNLVALIVVDYWPFWILNLIGVFCISAFGFLQPKEFPSARQFFFPMISLLVSVFFLFLPSPVSLNLPILVSPSATTSWGIVQSTLGSRVSSLFFGAGPGTFPFVYELYKPVSVNASVLWNLGFAHAQSAFLNRLSDVGLLGTVAWLLVFGWVMVLSLRQLLRQRDHETWKMTYVLFVTLFVMMVAQFLYPTNMTFETILWALTGMLAVHVLPGVWRADFVRLPRAGLLLSFLFVALFTGIVGSLVVIGERTAAEVFFSEAIAPSAQKDLSVVSHRLAQAVTLNPWSDTYFRNLSFALFTQAGQTAVVAPGQKLSDDQTKKVGSLVTQAVQMGVRATQLEPYQVANWQVLGSIYRDVMPFTKNADVLSVQAFSNAINLEPANPTHFVDLARAYLTAADQVRAQSTSKNADDTKKAKEQEQNLLSLSEQALNKAVELKGDYLLAHYYLATTFEREEKTDEAIARLVALTQRAPNDVGLGFELAQLYIRTKKLDAARTELERIVKVNPKFSNALWYLASVSEWQNQHDKAIEYVKRVVELNPDNQDAKDRLQKLQSGQTTSALPEPLSTPTDSSSNTPTVDVEAKL